MTLHGHGTPRGGAKRSRIRLLLGVVAALGAGAVGHGGCKDGRLECDDNESCPLGEACVFGECVPRLSEPRPLWSLEVRGVPNLPPREFPQLPISGAPLSLTLDAGVMAMVQLTGSPPATAAEPTELPALLAIPSAIPGRRDLMFEAVGRPAGAPPPYEFSWLLPSDTLGRTAEMRLVPGAPLYRQMPPWRLPWQVASAVTLNLPGADDTLVLSGTLENPAPEAPAQLEARVVAGDRLLSNVVSVKSGERFELRMQKSVLAALAGSAYANQLEVVLRPPESQPGQAQLSVPITPGKIDLGALRPPLLPPATAVTVPVVQTPPAGGRELPVAGATVVFSTSLEATAPVRATYSRASQTDATGRATFSLIPGSGGDTRRYVVRIIPPATSSAGALCVPDYPVAAAVSDTPRVGATIRLPRRAALGGRVLRADGRPAASVRVRATRQGDLFGPECGGGAAPTPAEITTDGDGVFGLWVDPGVYRIEYEPPVGSALPHFREEDILIGADLHRDVVLPRGLAVEGAVTDGTGAPVGMAEIRAFSLDAQGRAQVEGKALSGRDGTFRLVLPQKP